MSNDVEMGGSVVASPLETREQVMVRIMSAFERARAAQFPTWDGEPEIHQGPDNLGTYRIWGWRAVVPAEYVL